MTLKENIAATYGAKLQPASQPKFDTGGILTHSPPPNPLPPKRPDGWKAVPAKRTAADIMREMAATADARNGVYKDNWKMIVPMLNALFPNGVPPHLVTQDFWHLFELMLVKIARFASTDCTHIDSIHDAGAYCAFVQLAIEENSKEEK